MLKNNFINRLEKLNISNPEQEFIWLACHALNVSTAQLMNLNLNNQDICDKLNKIISRREQGEPLQYIIKTGTFYGRDFITGPGTLIPRQDTESLIDAALYLFQDKAQDLKFLDWGTGTGCIAITLLLEFQNSCAFMLDKSQAAIHYAQQNLASYKLNERTSLLLNLNPDELNNLDFIISNPPYIPTNQIQNLMREVRYYEPHLALDGGPDGLDYYKIIFKLASSSLKPHGYLILELGNHEQVNFLKNFNNNFKFIKSFQDSSGFPRCMTWQLL